ncbi:MAG: DUF4383 domain-containing protein [Acidobacteriaceae bacterium]
MNENRFLLRRELAAAPLASKLTTAGLLASALAIWIQWLSRDPAYRTFPPGPIFFVVVAAVVAFGTRWWWTPLIGALLSLLVTAGWFSRLSPEMQRLSHPASLGGFASGIFLGTLLQITALALTDVAGIVATVQNFSRRQNRTAGVKAVLRVFGSLFVLMGVVVIATRGRVDFYHNLMHLTWGILAIAASFAATKSARLFCVGSGVFYLSLGLLGLALGNSAAHMAWHFGPMHLDLGDHIFHLVLGGVFLTAGLVRGRRPVHESAKYREPENGTTEWKPN